MSRQVHVSGSDAATTPSGKTRQRSHAAHCAQSASSASSGMAGARLASLALRPLRGLARGDAGVLDAAGSKAALAFLVFSSRRIFRLFSYDAF